jgi:hypothetical protein
MAASLGLLPPQATAQDQTTIYAEGPWRVFAGEGDPSLCMVVTVNLSPREQSMAFSLYDTGLATLYMSDPNWQVTPRQVNVTLSVNGVDWPLVGQTQPGAVMMFIEDYEVGAGIAGGLAQGTVARLYNDEGRALLAFSLVGARPAMAAFFECVNTRLSVDSSQVPEDPF